MKKKSSILIYPLILLGLILTLTISCKKGEEIISSGNFIEINGDRRIIDASNPDVNIQYGTWGYPGYQFSMTDKQFSTGIAGFTNNQIEIFVDIYDLNLSKNDYALVDYAWGDETKGFAQMFIRPKKDGLSVSGLFSNTTSGNVKYSLINSIKTVEFSKIKLVDVGGTSYTVSGRMEFYGYPHNTQ